MMMVISKWGGCEVISKFGLEINCGGGWRWSLLLTSFCQVSSPSSVWFLTSGHHLFCCSPLQPDLPLGLGGRIVWSKGWIPSPRERSWRCEHELQN